MGILGTALIIFLLVMWFIILTAGAGLVCLGLSIFFSCLYQSRRKKALALGLPVQKDTRAAAIFTGVLAGMVALLYLLLGVAFYRAGIWLEEKGGFDVYSESAASTEIMPASHRNLPEHPCI